MRVAIVGTSNAVMRRGYAYAISTSPLVSHWKNMSVGMSGSMLYALTTCDVDFADFDVCIMDFCVNEEIFVKFGLSQDIIAEAVMALARRAWLAGCLPVILLLPRQSCLIAVSGVHGLYWSIAKSLNLPVFDAARAVERLVVSGRISRGALFKDDGHLHEWVALALGHSLICELYSHCAQITEASAVEPWSAHEFSILPASGQGLSSITRRNSLIEAAFAIVGQDDVLHFEVPTDDLATAVCANLAKTSGCLVVEGAKTEYFDFRNDAFSEVDENYMLAILPLLKPVQAEHGGIVVRIKAVSDAGIAVRPLALFPAGQRESQVAVAHAEGAHLIVRSARQYEVPTKPNRRFHRDLAAGPLPALETVADLYVAQLLS